VFGERMPHLSDWLRQFALPSVAAIVLTYACLRLTQHRALKDERIRADAAKPHLSHEGKLAAVGIAAIGAVLLVASALDWQLGLPTFVCGVLTTAAVLLLSRQSPWPVLKDVSWGVLPLVAGLFVMVEALVRTGAIAQLAALLHQGVAQSEAKTAWATGIIIAVADNIANNLPVGLVAGSVVGQDHLPTSVTSAVLIGVDLGPNLSVTGSLATILWLVALRREELHVSAWHFLRLGIVVMPPALLAALATVIW
jgi:arsenical pump membrane protein